MSTTAEMTMSERRSARPVLASSESGKGFDPGRFVGTRRLSRESFGNKTEIQVGQTFTSRRAVLIV
jgi:hypothetical protein